MSTLGRAVKNTVALTAAELISKALNFVFIAVLVRQLTPADFGGYTTVMTLIGFMVPLADLGISQILVREIAADRARAGSLLFNALVATTGLAGLAWLILAAIASFANYPDALRPLVMLAGLAVVGNTLIQATGSVLRGFERMDVQATLSSGLLLITSAIGIGLALARWGLAAQIVSNAIISSIGALLMLIIVHRRFARLQWTFNARVCRDLISQALPVAVLVAYGVILHWMDVLILGQVRTMNEVAIYGSAIKVIDLVSIVSTSASAALFPVLSMRWRESLSMTRDLYERSLRFFAAFGLAVATGLTVLAEPIVVIIFGTPYLPAALPLRLYAWAFFFQVISGPLGILLIVAGDRLRKFVPVTGLVVLGNVVLNLLLAPRLSYVGSAIAFVITAFATFLIRQWVAADYFDRPPSVWAALRRPALAALVMGAGLLVLRPWSIIISLPIGGIIFIGMLQVLGELKQDPYRALFALVGNLWREGLGWRQE